MPVGMPPDALLWNAIQFAFNGGSGAGAVGTNYRIVAGELYVKNATTGLWNKMGSVGADPTQVHTLEDGVA